MKININVELVNLMFPFFIHFVFKSKLNITAIDLHSVNK